MPSLCCWWPRPTIAAATRPQPATSTQSRARPAKPYSALKSAHLADHEKLFRRVDVVLAPPAGDPTVESLPIDERLARYKKGQEDPGLSALYFQFGRYLLMGSSRTGSTGRSEEHT